MSSHSSQHPQEVLLAQFSPHVHKGGIKPHSFNSFHLLLVMFLFQASSEQLELETADDSCSTPLLLAVMGGDLETVQLLVEREAKVSAINSHNHGVVELCAFKQYLDILK